MHINRQQILQNHFWKICGQFYRTTLYCPKLIVREQECHIQGQCEQAVVSSHIVIAELDGMGNVVFLRMPQYRAQRLGIARRGLTFHRHALSLVADEEVKLHSAILMEIIQLAWHLPEDVGK